MDLDQLRSFVAVVDAGTVIRAATRRRLAQPSVSQHLRRLEASLGVKLFDRVGRGLVLTDAGRALLPRARRILAEVDEARIELASDVEAGEGAVAIGAIPTMAPYILPPALRRLRSKLPRCAIEVREDYTERLVESVADGALDAAITSTPIDDPTVAVEVLGVESLLVAVAATHPLAGDAKLGIPALRKMPTVGLEEVHCLGRQISAFCGARRTAGEIVCRTTQLATVIELVRLGIGAAFVPEMAARAHHDHGAGQDWRCVPVTGEAPRRDIAILWRRGRTRPRAVEQLATDIREALGRGEHAYPPPRTRRA